MDFFLKSLSERDSFFNEKPQIIRDSCKLTDILLQQRQKLIELREETRKTDEELLELRQKDFDDAKKMQKEDIVGKLVTQYRERDLLSKNISEMEEEIAQLSKDNENKQREISQMKKNEEQARKDIKKLQSEFSSLANQKEKLKNEQKEIAQQKDDINKNILAISENITKLQNEIEGKKNESNTEHEKAPKYSLNSCTKTFKVVIPKDAAHTPAVTDLCFGPEAATVFVAGSALHQCTVRNFQENMCISLKKTHINRLKLDETMSRAAIGCEDCAVKIIDVITGRVLTTLSSHKEPVTDIEWCTDNTLISVSKDRLAKIHDVNRGETFATVNGVSQLFSITKALKDDNNVYVAGCMDGHLRVIDIRDKNIAMKLEKIHTRSVSSVLTKPDDQTHVVSVGLDNKVCVTDLAAAQRINQFSTPELIIKNPMSNACITPNGSFLCVGSHTNSVILFDISEEIEEPIINKHHQAEVLSACATNDLLITGDVQGNICYWEYKQPEAK